MPSYEPVLKNGASGAIFYIGLPDAAVGGSFKTNPTIAAGDFKISIDGGALANLTNLPTVTPAGGAQVKFILTQAETNGDNLAIWCVDQTATKEWADTLVTFQTAAAQFDTLSTRIPAALVGGRMDSNLGTVTAGAITSGAFAAGAINAAAIATDAIGSAQIAASAVTEIQTGLATSAALATVQADTDDIQTRLPAALVGGKIDANVGTVTAGAIGSAAFAAGAITATVIATDAIGSAQIATSAVTEIQTGLATSAALATVQADTDDIQTRLPAALVGGKMDANLGTVTAGAISSAAFASGAINRAALNIDTGMQTVRSGTAQAGGGTGTVILDAGASATTDFYKGLYIYLTSNTGAGQVRLITAYNGATKTATLDTALAVAADATTTYALMPEATDYAILGTGAITSATFAAGAITSSTFAAGAINAAAIATDAIGSAQLATTAVTEIQTGLATSAALATVQADTDDIQTRLPAALVGGKIDANMGTVTAGAITTAAFAAGAINAAAIATDAIGSAQLAASAVTEIQTGLATTAGLATVQADTDDIQSRLPAALVGGKMDSNLGTVTAGAITTAAFASGAINRAALNVDTGLQSIRSGTCQAGGGTGTVILDAGASATTDFYKGLYIYLTSNTGAGQVRLITAYNGATKTATLDSALLTAADATTTYALLTNATVYALLSAGAITTATFAAGAINAAAIATDAIGSAQIATSAVTEIQTGLATSAALATVQADTDDIQTRLPAALVAGRMDSSTGAMAANVITATAINAAAITAAKFATDAIDSNALAATAVTEIQTGLATSASITAVQADTDDIQTRLPAALVGGKIDANVGTVTAGAITAAGIASAAITSAKFATDAIDGNALAASAVTEIQAGLSTLDQAGVRAALGLSAANLGNLNFSVPSMGRGTVSAGSTPTSITTSSFTPAGAIANQFADRIVIFDANTTTASLRGVAKGISASTNAANPTFTVAALPATPVSGDTFTVI